MKKGILSMLLLLVGSTMTWAQTAPEGLSIDTDYSSDQEGYYYVNMPSLSSIEFTSTDLVFKVYDNGGKNDIADKDGKLQLKAPVGYCFEIEVTIVGLDEDALVIYNSSLSEATPNKQLYSFYGHLNSGGTYNQFIGTYRTTDNWMYIDFFSQSDLAGFELTVRIKPLLRGQGTEEKPYEIYYSDAWDLLCTNVAAGETYEGKYFKQMADFTITQGVGTDDYAFSGHYDGNKHELACAISAADQMAAPFCRVNGAEIKDLHVTGSVATSMTDGADHTAGLIGKADGNVTVNNVRVSATVTGLTYYSGFIGHGGNNSTINMTGCVFDGALTEKTTGETQHTGGFIGWGDNMTITMSNCLFDGTSTIGTGGSGAKTFHPVGYHSIANGASVTIGLTNVYYTAAPSASQSSPNLGAAISNGEKQAYSITAADANVTTLAISGDVANYTVSGLKGYAAGIEYGSTLYAGNGDEVNLTLAHADAEAGQHFSGYAVSGGGSLTTQNETSATLSMTDANQTISAEYADNASHNVSFVITETGWSTTPSGTAREGETVTVSYTGKNKVKYVVVKPNGALPSAASQIEMTGTKTDDTYSYSGTFTMGAGNMDVSNALYYKLGAEETLTDYQTTYSHQTTYEYKYYFLDRTLTKDVWNTFSSPFAIASGDMEKYFGAGTKVRKLDNTTIDGNILNLNFVNASSIEAGKPYIVKPTAANIDFSADGKEFEGVNLSPASASPDNTNYVDFVPTVGKTQVTGDPDDILMMTIEGELVHPEATGNMKGFRGYFVMHAPAWAKAFRIDFGDGEQTTGIISVNANTNRTNDTNIYDLSGRRVQNPTKGIYIKNGRKVVIK